MLLPGLVQGLSHAAFWCLCANAYACMCTYVHACMCMCVFPNNNSIYCINIYIICMYMCMCMRTYRYVCMYMRKLVWLEVAFYRNDPWKACEEEGLAFVLHRPSHMFNHCIALLGIASVTNPTNNSLWILKHVQVAYGSTSTWLYTLFINVPRRKVDKWEAQRDFVGTFMLLSAESSWEK